MKTKDTAALEQGLAQHYGTETWYRHPLSKILYTEGVKYLADEAGAYWLVDEIAFAQIRKPVRAEQFQVWVLTVKEDATAKLHCEDGNGRTVYTTKIPFTDFPLPEIKLWFTDNVLLLPTEY